MSPEESPKPSSENRLVNAYRQMLERIKATIDEAEKDRLPRLQDQISEAMEKAVELGELTREEAEKIGNYLQRDLVDAAEFMADTGKELRDWLSFDRDLIEEKILNMFALMVDHTREQLHWFAEQARESEYLHTGEVTAMGTVRCVDCDKEMHFHAPGHIPPCPSCRGTRFKRVAE